MVTKKIEKTEFVIDRSKWRCGLNGENAKGLGQNTLLLGKEGYMCCLGQVASQLGYSNDQLLDLAEPHEMSEGLGEPIDNILTSDYENTEFTMDAMDINDDKNSTIRQKEAALKMLFKENDLSVKFIGKSVKYKNEEVQIN